MSHFYTRSGDDGSTGLLGPGRMPKYSLRAETIGALDEASAALGLGRALARDPAAAPVLLAAQRDLYHLMAEAAAAPENAARFRQVDATRVAWLEHEIDRLGAQTPMPREFIVPGDAPAGAALALARTVVRRAERRVAEMLHTGELSNPALLHYLNRLSSLCFVLELLENRAAGAATPTLAKD